MSAELKRIKIAAKIYDKLSRFNSRTSFFFVNLIEELQLIDFFYVFWQSAALHCV